MAAGRHIEIYRNLNNSRTVHPIFTKFGMELRLHTLQTTEVSKLSKSKMAADEKRKFTIKKKIEYLRNGSLYMHQIWYISSAWHPEQACGPKIAKFVIQDGRRPKF